MNTLSSFGTGGAVYRPLLDCAFCRFLGNQSWGEPMYSLMYQTDAPISIKVISTTSAVGRQAPRVGGLVDVATKHMSFLYIIECAIM